MLGDCLSVYRGLSFFRDVIFVGLKLMLRGGI